MFYVSTGEKTRMYTLRTQFEEEVYFQNEEGVTSSTLVTRDYYIRNLSIDKEKAVETAKLLGYEVSEPKFTLEEIQRRTKEELEKANEQLQLAIKQREEEYEQERILKENQLINSIKAGYFPFGMYKDTMIKNCSDISYLMYWLKTDSEDNIVNALKGAISIIHSNVKELLEIKPNGNYFGEVGKRQNGLVGTVIGDFNFESFYGWTYVFQIVLDSGELLVYMGSSCLDCTTGDKIKFNAGIKEHTVYKEVPQTKVQRITKLEVVE